MKATCDSTARLSLGAYVLGALDPVERAEVDAHLAGCDACRDELAGLAAMPGLLARVRLEDVLEPNPSASPAMAERLIARLRAARRTRRRRLALVASAIAAAAVTAGTVVIAARDTGSGGTASGVASVSASNPQTGVAATIGLRPASWGTAIRVRLRGVPPGTRCWLVAFARTGRREVAGTWRATYDGTADVETATAIPRSELASVAVMTAGKRPLVRAPL
jgi:predicted anti-sigma-YlaC factor YlaD